MRENYNSFGVENYYNLVQESCEPYLLSLSILVRLRGRVADWLDFKTDRNPHYPGLKKVLSQLMDTYVTKEEPKTIKVLDLAAGSGEATEVRESCERARLLRQLISSPVRNAGSPSLEISTLALVDTV